MLPLSPIPLVAMTAISRGQTKKKAVAVVEHMPEGRGNAIKQICQVVAGGIYVANAFNVALKIVDRMVAETNPIDPFDKVAVQQAKVNFIIQLPNEIRGDPLAFRQ